jgi:hypothetical protein
MSDTRPGGLDEFLRDPLIRPVLWKTATLRDGGLIVPASIDLIGPVTKASAFVSWTEEMWIDAGGEPPPRYWQRELAARIERRRIRNRLRVRIYRARWFLASLPRRAGHVRDALLDRPCCEEEPR